MSIFLILLVYASTALLLWVTHLVHPLMAFIVQVVLIFFCLAGTTLIKEVRNVFLALDQSLEQGRQQVARIVGRDTSQLSA